MKTFLSCVLFAGLALALAGRAHSAPAEHATPGASRADMEAWIIKQVAAGEVADLTQHFPGKNARVLPASFLVALLSDALPGVKPTPAGIRVMGAVFEEPVYLDNMKINHEVWLDHCEFKAAVSCIRTEFQTVEFDSCTFSDEADFAGVKVSSTAFFRDSVFVGPVSFNSADIANQIDARRSRFQDAKEGASFDGIIVGDSVFFDQTTFAGPVTFSTAKIASQLLINEARFDSKDSEANFESVKVGGLVSIRKTVFMGMVDFGSSEIGSQLLAENANFSNREKGAGFNSLKVARSVFFNGAVFAGPTDFGGAEFANELHLDDAQFQGKDWVALSDMKIGGVTSLKGATFAGPVGLTGSSFLDLFLDNPRADATPISQLDLAHVSIKRTFHIGPLRIHDLMAQSLHVEGASNFFKVQVERTADLSDSDFNQLNISGLQLPAKPAGQLQIQGMNYKSIRAARDEDTSHEALLKWVDQAAYGADVYGNLEAFFARRGYKEDADRAFVAGQARERNEKMSWYSFGYYKSWLLQGIGYGRYPGRALFACALVVGLGCGLFDRSKMVPKMTEHAGPARNRRYSRFWYSLELFLPVVELESDDAWEPGSEHRFLRNYMRVHVLLGWILVPIALAAVTGLIK